MPLRKLQSDFSSTIDSIIAGELIKNIIIVATPGAGKSTIPIIAGKLIEAKKADALCWISPRKALQTQGERNFLDPFFRDMFGHDLTIRASTNDTAPCRGTNGFITTYQAVGVDDQNTIAREFQSKRYILILDEFHHLEKDGVWHEAIDPIVQRAEFFIGMTGTIERGDKKLIAYTPYNNHGLYSEPNLDNPPAATKIIQYTRQDALDERAIVPLKFSLHDGKAVYVKDDNEIRVGSLARSRPKDVGPALYTALETEFATELLENCLIDWIDFRNKFSSAQMLVVTANIKQAETAINFLSSRKFNARIATSHDDKNAQKAINDFKLKRIDILVTIAMAYEGLDVPAISHIALLTNIRSTPWIIQCLARSARIDTEIQYNKQYGMIYAPDDPLLREVIKVIENEQLPIIQERKKDFQGEQLDLFDNSGESENEERNIYNIKPIGSEVTNQRNKALLSNGGQLSLVPGSGSLLTPKEVEISLRKKIDRHIGKYARDNFEHKHKINGQILETFFKPRSEMTATELSKVLYHVERNYPIKNFNGSRRTFKKKVVTWTE